MTLSPISIRRSIKPRGTRRVPPLPLDRRRRRDALRIGLVNNMPDAALRSTERQFRDLLASAAGERAVELKLFSCKAIRNTMPARFTANTGAMSAGFSAATATPIPRCRSDI
jgi:hypothetical protein